jgi:hypothetical protein
MNHGNGKIWTAMWPHNVVIATPDYIEADGSVGMKWPWWRGIKGKLKISGRRLDGKAPPLTAFLPDYGRSGFQPSGISFPTEGCWEVTGALGGAKLTFVTLILKAARYWASGRGRLDRRDLGFRAGACRAAGASPLAEPPGPLREPHEDDSPDPHGIDLPPACAPANAPHPFGGCPAEAGDPR